MKELRAKAEPDCVCFLAGNKLDLVQENPSLRQVSEEEARELAKELDLVPIETSAKANLNVNEVFESLVECIHRVRKDNDEVEETPVVKPGFKRNDEKDEKCC